MDINHIWSFGREQFQEYNAKGTMTALGLLSLVALLYLFYNGEKGKELRREYRVALGFTWAGVILYVPLLIPGFSVKAAFFAVKGYGRDYIEGLGKGFKLCRKARRTGKKIPFRFKDLPAYGRIQLDLWVNTVRRLAEAFR